MQDPRNFQFFTRFPKYSYDVHELSLLRKKTLLCDKINTKLRCRSGKYAINKYEVRSEVQPSNL